MAHIRLSCRTQIFVALLVIGAGAWVAFSSTSHVLQNYILAAKDQEIAKVRMKYFGLIEELEGYQKRFTGVTGALEDYNRRTLDLVEQKTALQKKYTTVESELRTTKDERQRVVNARENLKSRLRELEDDMKSLANRNFALKDNLSSIERDLEQAVSERNQALFEGARMRRQVADLEARLTDLQAAERDVVARLTEQAVQSLDEFTKIVELAGLDVEQILAADKTLMLAQGGPFVKASETKSDGKPADALQVSLTNLDVHLNQVEGLQAILRKLPLTSPMDYFHVTSKYGKRRDPFNRRWAMHYGLDMGGAYKSPVYSTAPGVVTYVGWKGNYGRLVEIDHGAGVKTRFGHLAKTLVQKGQKVKFRDKIGLLGNSGRSSGAHLHYEVLFNGRPRDPMKFIKAGRHVFQE